MVVIGICYENNIAYSRQTNKLMTQNELIVFMSKEIGDIPDEIITVKNDSVSYIYTNI